MTRPTPTQGAQSEAARVPRVSDTTFTAICNFAEREARKGEATTFQMIALDSRDKDATIADLERRLAEAERERDAAYIQGVKEGAAAMSERD